MTMHATQTTQEGAIPSSVEEWDYRCQWDPHFGDTPYTVTNNPEQTIAHGGCVPVLQTVVARSLCGLEVEPPGLAAWNVANGMRTPNNGTKRISWNLFAIQTGLKQDVIGASLEEIGNALAVGGIVVASLKTPDRVGLGTPSGHVVGFRAVSEAGMTKVIDVNSPRNTSLEWDILDILPYVVSNLRHLRGPRKLSAGLHTASRAELLRATATKRG